ncbi:hypothetical protein CEE44_03165 [Candidatus Woesearchaeota archaeon B3_Woes]|nr:MAG: hypothetical protein CEE44_03165 [Candidatus Woesearchaeota archaeon B3_Woes]
MKKTRGVIYIATGEKYINEVLVSAASLKKHMPDLPVTLFSDLDVKSSYFDKILKIKNPVFGFEDKVRYMYKSPYDLTLFLDTDTYICDDVSELFDLLNRFDIAVAHVPTKNKSSIIGTPESFVLIDTGIILFKKSLKIKKLFSEWLRLYNLDKKRGYIRLKSGLKSLENKIKWKEKGIPDALNFNKVLYNSKIRFVTLTKEYDFRAKCGFVNWKVKILHRRNWDFALVESIINSYSSPRVFFWSFDRLHVFPLDRRFGLSTGLFRRFGFL